MIVVDTNVIGYLYLNNVHTPMAEKALQRDRIWVAPLLWRSEFRSVLASYLRKGILTLADAVSIISEASALMQGGEYQVNSVQVLALVKASTLSAYDCEFVALARDLKVQLVTMDRNILAQFPGEAVSLAEFAV